MASEAKAELRGASELWYWAFMETPLEKSILVWEVDNSWLQWTSKLRSSFVNQNQKFN